MRRNTSGGPMFFLTFSGFQFFYRNRRVQSNATKYTVPRYHEGNFFHNHSHSPQVLHFPLSPTFMETHFIYYSSSSAPNFHINGIKLSISNSSDNLKILRTRNNDCACLWQSKKNPSLIVKNHTRRAKRRTLLLLKEEPTWATSNKRKKKKGTIAGAVALIIGTSIGSGILALPRKASPAGVLPCSISMIICWAFLLIEALLLIEINVFLRQMMRRNKEEDDELEVISIRTMAQETLGDLGGALATVTYTFLGYSSMIAYSSKSGEILSHCFSLPESFSGVLFTGTFTLLISIGGTRVTDQVNQWLTASMIGLLLAIEAIAVVSGGWSGVGGSADWGKVPATIPVLIFTLVYHDLAPVLCAYLGSDLARLRASVLLGSLVPLLALLVWDAVVLGLSAGTDQVADPIELLSRVRWSGVPFMVEAFSLLAVGTSLIGTLLGFLEFFKEQLKNSLRLPAPMQRQPQRLSSLVSWWGRNKISITATAIVVSPSLLVSSTVPDAFSAATDIAGGYCMTMLYGVLPPAMAWAISRREAVDPNERVLSRTKPALLGVGLFACGIVLEQLLQDFLALQF